MSTELSMAVSGVLAARQAIETVGSNIANARTPGYARREVRFTGKSWNEATGRDATSAVRIESILRMKDAFLEGRLQSCLGSLARNEVQEGFFSEIEGILQEPSEEGVGAALEEFFNQWQSVATRPDDATERTTLLLKASYLAEKIYSLRQGLVDIESAVTAQIGYHIDEINRLAERVADLNTRLAIESASGAYAPLGLHDERDRLVRELAELAGAENLTPNEATSRLTIGSALLVEGATWIKLAPPVNFDAPITIDFGGKAVPVAPEGGKIAGLIELLQEILPRQIGKLDEFANALIKQVNSIHVQGINQEGRFSSIGANYAPSDYDGDGDPNNDMLAQAGLPFDPSAGVLVINVVNNVTGEVTANSISVDPAAMSHNDLTAAIGARDNISVVMQEGRMQIVAAQGFSFDFVADQGTDILAALGVNAFFGGSDASNIRLSSWVEDHPSRIAAGKTPNSGDGWNAIAMSELRYAEVAGDQQITLSDHLRRQVAEIGSESANLKRTVRAQKNLADILAGQEEAISGVSIDEEAAKLIEYQQMYQTCARYLSTVARLTEYLLDYL